MYDLQSHNPLTISEIPSSNDDGVIGPFMPPNLMPPDTLNMSIINSLKQMAFMEYSKALTDQVPESQPYRLPENFYNLEAKLAKFRGSVIATEIKNQMQYKPPTYKETFPTRQDDFPGVVMELQIFDEEYVSLLTSPLRQVASGIEGHLEIFRPTHNANSLKKTLDILRKVSWTADIPSDKLLFEIKNDRILQDILSEANSGFRNTATHGIEDPMNTGFLGGNFSDTDNTARSSVFQSNYMNFTTQPIQHAKFQIASNVPNFTQTEAWQNWIVLHKMNMDIYNCLSGNFISSVDIKVQINHNGRDISLVWTIYRFNPDTFDITQFAYKSTRPQRTLLTIPSSTKDIQNSPHPDDIDTVSLRCQHFRADSDKIARIDEVRLMKLHATMVKNLDEMNQVRKSGTKIVESKGWVYYYPFWTVLASCTKLQATSAGGEEFYVTAYTIIHRTSEYAADRGGRGRPLAARQQGAPGAVHQLPPPQNIPPGYQQPHSAYQPYYQHHSPNHQRRTEILRMADERKFPFMIFGLYSDEKRPIYYYIDGLNMFERKTLQHRVFQFQTIIYKKFYSNVIESLAGKDTNVARYIQKFYQGQGKFIAPYPGLFQKWITDFPKGFPGEQLIHTDTAKQEWSKLWMEFFKGPQGTSFSPESYSEDEHAINRDPRIKAYMDRDSPPPAEPIDGRGSRSRSRSRGSSVNRGSSLSRGSSRSRSSSQSSGIPRDGRDLSRGRTQTRPSSGTRQHFNLPTYSDSPHLHQLAEEAPQISEMQHEIDSLRRSLNQLALLHG